MKSFIKTIFIFSALFIILINTVAAESQISLPMLKQDGAFFTDLNGNKVILKGTNIGNWLMMEMWMGGINTQGASDQYLLENLITKRFGKEEKDRLMNIYRDNYITERDFQIIQSFKMNVVRLPFWYTILEDDEKPYTLKPNAWKYMDWAIDTAEKHGIYTIIDMHGAPGCQSRMEHTGRAGYNKLWDDKEYQKRTIWIWEQIAERYKDRSAVAAYDFLNEPWGTSDKNLKEFVERLYKAVRNIDKKHILVLPGTAGSIDFYGDPKKDLGMENVAFEMHFYPGLFGWGEQTIEFHKEFLTKNCNGWNMKMEKLQTPLIIGEFNVVADDAGGAEMMRHTFDAYNGFGWAATMWSYKVFTDGGGFSEKGGSWAMVSNPVNPYRQPQIGVNSWQSAGWDSSFKETRNARTTYTVKGDKPIDMYLLLKTGCNGGGKVSIVIDEVSIIEDKTKKEMLKNGGFGSDENWSKWNISGKLNYDFKRDEYTADTGNNNPLDAEGPALHITADNDANGGVYQKITLQGGQTYTISGVYKDLGSENTWCEVYLSDEKPVDSKDYTGPKDTQAPDFNEWSKEDIEKYFKSLSTMDYSINESLKFWLTTFKKPGLFEKPVEVVVPQSPYGGKPAEIPGKIEAENFDLGSKNIAYSDTSYDNSGDAKDYRKDCDVDVEKCGEGGYNLGYLSPAEWLKYTVDVKKDGKYSINIRTASMENVGKIHIQFNEKVLTDTIDLPPTGDWQTWKTTTVKGVDLKKGVHEMKLVIEEGEFNLNYFEFSIDK